LLVLVLSLAAAGPSQTALIGVRHERGVETKMVGSLLADFPVGARALIYGAVAFSAPRHAGLCGLGFGAEYRVLGAWDASLGAALQHEQWNDWRAGENRVLVFASARPAENLRLGLGTALRLPVYEPARYWLPFYWHSDAPELNLMYEAEWLFLDLDRVSVSARVANIERLTVRNAQQFPFSLKTSWQVAPGWTVRARCGSCINGLSGLLLNFGETFADAGVKYEF